MKMQRARRGHHLCYCEDEGSNSSRMKYKVGGEVGERVRMIREGCKKAKA